MHKEMNPPPARNLCFCIAVVIDPIIQALSTYTEQIQLHAVKRDIRTTRNKQSVRSTYGGKIEILVVSSGYIVLGVLHELTVYSGSVSVGNSLCGL